MTGIKLSDIKNQEDLDIIAEIAKTSGKSMEEVAQGLEWVHKKLRKAMSHLTDEQFNQLMNIKVSF